MLNCHSWGLTPSIISLCKPSRSFFLNWGCNDYTRRHSSLTIGKTQNNSIKKTPKSNQEEQEDWGVKSKGKREVTANKSLSRRLFHSVVLEETDGIAACRAELVKDMSHSFTGSKVFSAAEKRGQLLSELPWWSDSGRITWKQTGSEISLYLKLPSVITLQTISYAGDSVWL